MTARAVALAILALIVTAIAVGAWMAAGALLIGLAAVALMAVAYERMRADIGSITKRNEQLSHARTAGPHTRSQALTGACARRVERKETA